MVGSITRESVHKVSGMNSSKAAAYTRIIIVLCVCLNKRCTAVLCQGVSNMVVGKEHYCVEMCCAELYSL